METKQNNDPLVNQNLRKDEGRWQYFDLPSIPLVHIIVPPSIITHLWECIEQAKKKNTDCRGTLAGNITSSLALEDIDNKFYRHILAKPVQQYLTDYNAALSNTFTSPFIDENDVGDKECEIVLSQLWVNFQKKHEFNPFHHHKGLLSFVLWLRCPTEYEEQKKLEIAKTSNSNSISNVAFFYQDILGVTRTHMVEMGQRAQSNMYLFPSGLNHAVYPFFECDTERVSISGNIMLRKKVAS
tara:strand:+ start:64 stop:786 length:723 start_codon:yes stop_codon:yes gene_type:complete